jgi:hypothetical protein
VCGSKKGTSPSKYIKGGLSIFGIFCLLTGVFSFYEYYPPGTKFVDRLGISSISTSTTITIMVLIPLSVGILAILVDIILAIRTRRK